MPLREIDRSKTAFWGTQRILWVWCVVPFRLKNAPLFKTNGQGVSQFTFCEVLH